MARKWPQAFSILWCAACIAHADQFWVAYEGDDYPENEGWFRITEDGGAVRSLENGNFVLDTTSNAAGLDYYQRYFPGMFTLDAGEMFVFEFRVRVTAISHEFFPDTSIGFSLENKSSIAFSFHQDSLKVIYESGVTVPIAPDEFHVYRVETNDMATYSLFIDGSKVLSGQLFYATTQSRVAWGDGTQFVASRSEWDFIRFGVIPEPGAGLMGVIAMSWLLKRRREQ